MVTGDHREVTDTVVVFESDLAPNMEVDTLGHIHRFGHLSLF